MASCANISFLTSALNDVAKYPSDYGDDLFA